MHHLNAPSKEQMAFGGVVCALIITFSAAFFMSKALTSPWRKAQPVLFAEWEKKVNTLTGRVTVHRKLAETPGRCLRDHLNAGAIRADILQLETSQGGTPLKGIWPPNRPDGLKKSELPAAQGRFLSADNGKWIYSQGLDFSSCKDVSCVLNTVYGTPGGDAGPMTYWWFLKMGYVISTAEQVPGFDFSKEKIPYEKFQFLPEELAAFTKISWTLPEQFRAIPSLKTFHRIPPDYIPTIWKEKKWCGQYSGNASRGTIALADRCLEIEKTEGDFGGHLYVAIPHEMAHALDMWMGRTDKYSTTYFSQQEAWCKLSGWECVTYKAKDELVTECKLGEKGKWSPFVSTYAETSPMEDFAETVAYFRYRADKTLMDTPDKAAFVSKAVYNGRTYDAAGLDEYYFETVKKAIAPQLIELVNECNKDLSINSTSTSDANKATLSLDIPLAAEWKSCLENNLNFRVSAAFDDLRGKEWEACDYLAHSEEGIRKRVFGSVSQPLTELLKSLPVIKEVWDSVSKLREALSQQIDAREAYLHCTQEASPEGCFQQALTAAFQKTSSSFNDALGPIIDTEKTAFFNDNGFQKTQARVMEFFHLAYSGVDSIVSKVTEERWASCATDDLVRSKAGVPADALLTQPFTGKKQYIAGVILNCINSTAEEDLKFIRDRHTARLGFTFTDKDSIALSQTLLLPKYLDALERKLTADAKNEDLLRQSRRSAVIDVLVSGLVGAPAWLDGAQSEASATEKCIPAAITAFDEYFAHVTLAESLPVKFAALEDIRKAWSKEACSNALRTPALSQKLQRASKQSWALAMFELERQINIQIEPQGAACAKKISGGSRKSVQKRSNCLLSGWADAENRAIEEWKRTDRAGVWASRLAELMQYLSSRRADLQTAAVAQMEREKR